MLTETGMREAAKLEELYGSWTLVITSKYHLIYLPQAHQ